MDAAPRTRAALAAYTARLAIDPYPTYEGLTLYQAAAAELPALLAIVEAAQVAYDYYSTRERWPARIAVTPMERLGDALAGGIVNECAAAEARLGIRRTS